jgi:DNA-binding NarL/FixJ family response regulator
MKIAVADNHYLSKEGILSIITKIFSNAEIIILDSVSEMLSIQENTINLLIIDPDSFHLTDIVELSVFRKRNPDTSVLILTQNKQYGFVHKVIDSGVRNFVFKDSERDILHSALHSANKKIKYYDPQLNDILNRLQWHDREISELTKTEREIVKLIAQGLTTKEIAAKRFLSHHTIITHRKNIFKKLGINNSSELLMYALKAGIIDVTEYYI